jgi:thiol-disulfide isomerase/thioredoxin
MNSSTENRMQLKTISLFFFVLLGLASFAGQEPKAHLIIKASSKKAIFNAASGSLISVAEPNAKGCAIEIKSEKPEFYLFEDEYGLRHGIYFLKPGDTLVIDFIKDSVSGNAAHLNKYSSSVFKELEKNNKVYKKRYQLSPQEFADFLKEHEKKHFDHLEKYFAKSDLPEEFKSFATSEIHYKMQFELLQYCQYHLYYTTEEFGFFSIDSVPFKPSAEKLKISEPYRFGGFYQSFLREFVRYKLSEKQASEADSSTGMSELEESFHFIKSSFTGQDADIAFYNLSEDFSLHLLTQKDKFYTVSREIKEFFDAQKTNEYFFEKFNKNFDVFNAIAPGKPAPDFVLPDQNDVPVSLSDFKGNVIYAAFWGTWCGPCIASIPKYIQIQKEFENNPDVIFLYVALEYGEEDILRWKEFLKKKDFPGLHLVAEKQFYNPQLSPYKFNFAPSYVLIDKQGNVVSPRAGPPDEQIAEKIRSLLD